MDIDKILTAPFAISVGVLLSLFIVLNVIYRHAMSQLVEIADQEYIDPNDELVKSDLLDSHDSNEMPPKGMMYAYIKNGELRSITYPDGKVKDVKIPHHIGGELDRAIETGRIPAKTLAKLKINIGDVVDYIGNNKEEFVVTHPDGSKEYALKPDYIDRTS